MRVVLVVRAAVEAARHALGTAVRASLGQSLK